TRISWPAAPPARSCWSPETPELGSRRRREPSSRVPDLSRLDEDDALVELVLDLHGRLTPRVQEEDGDDDRRGDHSKQDDERLVEVVRQHRRRLTALGRGDRRHDGEAERTADLACRVREPGG